jgi:hypothetical protein
MTALAQQLVAQDTLNTASQDVMTSNLGQVTLYKLQLLTCRRRQAPHSVLMALE